VGIDGDFIRAPRKEGHFEVIAGKSMLSFRRHEDGDQGEPAGKCFAFVQTFDHKRNRGFIPNYGERYRNGERISTGFVESAVNQVVSKRMAKKQQMQWTQRGAHLLLQVRTRVLNEQWEDVFGRWYPDFRQQQSMKAAA
jgi:hypothetical protein